MRYKIKDQEYFTWLFEKDDNLQVIRERFMAGDINYYMPETDYSDIIDWEEVFEQVIEWEAETDENYSDFEYYLDLQKAVVNYIVTDQYFKYEVNSVANIMEIDERYVKGEIYNLLKLYFSFGIDTFFLNRKNINPVLKRAYKLKEQTNEYYGIVYNIEEVNSAEKYLISPFITKECNGRIIKIPRLLEDNDYIKKEMI